MTPARAPNDFPRPPILARLIVAITTPAREREFVLGDLHEGYNARLESSSPREARAWLWSEALGLASSRWPRKAAADRGSHRPREKHMSSLWNEIRFSLRSLRRAPLYSTLAILTAAVGIGASTAIFSVARPIIFEAAPYPSPEKVVLVWEREKDGSSSNIGFFTFVDLARGVTSFASSAAVSYWQATLASGGMAEAVAGRRVSAGYFTTLGVRPVLGRDFTPEEDAWERRRVIMLTYGIWQRQFGSDSSIVGRMIDVSGYQYLVAGVLPASFEDLIAPDAQIYSPLGYDAERPFACRTCRHLRMVARVKESATMDAALREAERSMSTMRSTYPTEYASVGASLERVDAFATKGVRKAVLALLGAAGLLLLMSCANVSSLMLGRGIERRTDLAVRTALGARVTRLVRQSAVEAALLWLIAAGVGLVLATWGVKALILLSGSPLPRVERMVIDVKTVGVALGLALLSAVLAGTLPALISARGAVIDRVRVGARNIVGRGTQRLRGSLLVAEVALALVMLCGTGLLIRTVTALLDVRLGFDAAHVVDVDVSLSGPRFNDTTVAEYYRRALDAARAVPGVESAALTSQLPLSGSFDGWGIHRKDKPSPNPENDPSAQRFGVSSDYFMTMRIPLLAGRLFSVSDNATSPRVAIVNRAMAERVFRGETVVGKEIEIGGTDGDWRTVVGVVDDVKHLSIDGVPELQVYVPNEQSLDRGASMVVRASSEQVALSQMLPSAIRAVDRGVAVTRAKPMEEFVAGAMAQRRFVLKLLAVFGVVALVLVTAGLYGVTAAGVAERRREIGLRAALGATRRRIVSTVLSRSTRLVGIGLAIGVVGALGLNRTLRTMLFGVSPSDPLTIVAAIGVLLIVAALAALVPARRAAAVDPAITLRTE
ncbi:MAG TPA: ADOP family duplicated permease [Gemmatimonadaceae bacterium]